MVPEMQKNQRQKGDAGERMPYRPRMPYIVTPRLSGDMQSHPGRKHRREKRHQCRIRIKHTPFSAHLFSAK